MTDKEIKEVIQKTIQKHPEVWELFGKAIDCLDENFPNSAEFYKFMQGTTLHEFIFVCSEALFPLKCTNLEDAAEISKQFDEEYGNGEEEA